MAEISEESILFITGEIHVVHAICDRALVPRDIDGEPLSMSQRVQTLEMCYLALVARIGMDPPSVIH